MIINGDTPFDQTPEGKLVWSLLVRGLMVFIPDQHALVVEGPEGIKYDLIHDGDDLRCYKCEYDTAPGTVVPVHWSDD